jgi:hypothetical protein
LSALVDHDISERAEPWTPVQTSCHVPAGRTKTQAVVKCHNGLR